MSPIDESLFTFLNQIKGSGTFLMQNKVEQIIPGLEIKGMGPVSFPLTAHSIQPLIEVAHQAPFGKGADTLVDTSVRNTWEIDGDQLVFHNPVWEATLKRMLRKVKKELGLKDKEIRADLYKLLIYEKDGFFLPHKDSEKAPGMFGTLIIGLPADHEGGQLQVSFGGKEEVVDFSGPVREFQMPYTAFYADCLHEIKPVTAGYRVCLIYNLIQEKGEKIRGITTTSGYVEGLRDILQEAAAAADTFPKIVMLNHAYTPENFSRAALKLDDAPRVEALETAAEQAGFESRLALLSHYEYGSWEDDYAYYGGSKKGGDTPEMEELFEAETSYEFWEGSAPGLGDMDPSKGVYIGASEPGEGKPSEYETEGYTGNAGMTVEYWYHYGAVVLWPKKWTPHMLQNAKNETQVEWLQYWLRFEPQSPERMHARTLLEQLTTAEVVETVEYKVSTLTPIIEGAIELNHQRFLQRFNWTNHFAAVDPDIWPELSEWLTPETMLSTFRQKGENGTFADFILITQTLLAGFEETYDSFLPIQHQIMQALPDFLHRFELGKPPASIYHWQADSERKTFEEQLESLLPLVVRLEQYAASDVNWHERMLAALTRDLRRSYLHTILNTAEKQEALWKAVLGQQLIQAAMKALRDIVAHPPEAPTDWQRTFPEKEDRESALRAEIREFMASPTQDIYVYTAVQRDRDNLSSALRHMRPPLDLTFETIKKGRPYTLHLIKTQASFEKALKHWRKDKKLLKKWEKKS